MDYVIFDLEWNQCPQGKARENPRIPFEIVEIGAIKLNDRKEEIGRFHELIRPLVYHRLHFRTKEVIHIDQKELNHARTFSPVKTAAEAVIPDESIAKISILLRPSHAHR